MNDLSKSLAESQSRQQEVGTILRLKVSFACLLFCHSFNSQFYPFNFYFHRTKSFDFISFCQLNTKNKQKLNEL